MKNNLWNYILALGAFALVGFLALNSSEKETSLTEEDFSKTDETLMEEDFLNNEFEANLEIQSDIGTIFTEVILDENKNVENNSENDYTSVDFENEIFVNKIIIAKNIDNDKESAQYREPIESYKTITTAHKEVVKEINYYPSFFIWASINTENVELENENDEIEPVNLSMSVKCNNQNVKKIDYNITAITPRWREWIEIDLTSFEEDTFKGKWEVEIINTDTEEVLESRTFELTSPTVDATAELKIK